MTKTLGDLKGLLPTKLERGNGHETRCKCTVCFHSYGYAQAHDEISAIPLMTIINKSFELGLIGKYGFAEGFSRRPELDEKSLTDLWFSLPYGNINSKIAGFIKAICAKFRAPDSSNEQAYEWGYADGKKSVGQPASSVNAELRSALEECIRVMIDNDEYGWSDDAIKQAEQALNSIKAGKDTK